MFSFQAIKHLTTVDGGMLACMRETDLPMGRRIRWFGIDRAQPRTAVDINEVGYKYHMNNVTAAIGLAQLGTIRSVIQRHMENGSFYDCSLSRVPGLQICQHDEEAVPAHWIYTVLADRKDDLAKHLTACGIECSQVNRRNDRHPVFADSQCDLPGLDAYYDRMLHIPCGWWVTDADRDYVVECILRGW
jgi:dTDP-4-amino-4,6-dideoxygalactose transaminase